MFQKLVQQFLQRFIKTMGRGPQNRAEWMQIQDQAVRHLNKTKGPPSIKKESLMDERLNDPFQGWDPKIVPKVKEKITIDDVLQGPVRSKGPKGERIWDLSQKKGEVIPFPDKGIRSLLKTGDVQLGTAPKTKKSTLKAKKEKELLLRDADEDILRIKRENKEAVDRFREKMNKEPDKFQYGGIAPPPRPGYGLGDIVKKHIPAEYRLYAKSILPGGEEGQVGSDYFTEDFKQDLRRQALEKYTRTGKLTGQVGEMEQQRGVSAINKLTGFPSTYASLGTYTYDIDPKTLDVNITDKYDWNPEYGKTDEMVGWVGDQPDVKQGDVDLSLVKDYIVDAVKTGELDKTNALEMIGNYFGGKVSKGKGFDIDIDIPTKEATPATEGSFAGGGIAPLVGEPTYAANFYDDRTPMKRGKKVKQKKTVAELKRKIVNDLIKQKVPVAQIKKILRMLPNPWEKVPHGKKRYKKKKDLPEGILELLEKDPGFDMEAFKDTYWAGKGWRHTDPTGMYGRRGSYSPMTGDIELNLAPFGEKEYTKYRTKSPHLPDRFLTDTDKAKITLHELRHKNIMEDRELFMTQPEWVQKQKGPGYLPQGGVTGHELYNRFLDKRYYPPEEDPSPNDPYFDKILREYWEPNARAYEERAKRRLSERRGEGIEVLAAEGGRIPYLKGKIVKGIKTLLKKKKPKVQSPLQKEISERTGKVFDPKTDQYVTPGKKVDKNRKLTDEEWRDYVEENSNDLSRYEEELTGDETIAQLDDMIAESRAYEADMYRQYKRGDLEKYVKPEVLEESRLLRQKKIDEVLDKAYDEIAGGSGFSGDYKYNADILSDSIAEQLGKGEFTDLSKMYQTDIYNTALNRITKNLKAKMDFKKGLKDVEQKIELQMFDPKDRKPNAEGGRAGYIFGGSAGLKGMWKSILKHLNKGRDKPITKLFPKLSADERRMEKLVMGTPEQKAFREGEVTHKLEGIDILINRLKHDKKIIERQAKNKAMKDEGLDFLMKQIEQDMPDVYGPHLKKYTNIDKDILQMENIKKNLIMKDRKLNAYGGRIGYSGGGKAGLPAVTMGTPQMNMQQPQMPATGPQPAGIPGGTIVAQNQMQQSPWMGSQMQQGIGGMPKPGGMPRPQPGGMPGPGGMPRPMANEGGRIGYAGGSMGRRAFLKLMAALAALPLVGTGVTRVAPKAIKAIETIKATDAAGMPAWFPTLVERVIKEGDDISKGAARIERETVHTLKLPESGTELTVYNDLIKGNVKMEVGFGKHGNVHGKFGQPYSVHLKKGDEIEEGIMRGKKEPDEFVIEEAEFTGGHPENVKFEESAFEKFGDEVSDLAEIEAFAKKTTTKKLHKAKKTKPKDVEGPQADWDDSLPDDPDDFYGDYASGGLAYALGE